MASFQGQGQFDLSRYTVPSTSYFLQSKMVTKVTLPHCSFLAGTQTRSTNVDNVLLFRQLVLLLATFYLISDGARAIEVASSDQVSQNGDPVNIEANGPVPVSLLGSESEDLADLDGSDQEADATFFRKYYRDRPLRFRPAYWNHFYGRPLFYYKYWKYL